MQSLIHSLTFSLSHSLPQFRLAEGKKVLVEGANAAMLDIDFGKIYRQCFGSGSVWIRFILVSRIRISFNETDPDPCSKKSAKMKENFNKNQQKSLEYHTFFQNY